MSEEDSPLEKGATPKAWGCLAVGGRGSRRAALDQKLASERLGRSLALPKFQDNLSVILAGVGVIGGVLCGRYVESQLFGIKALDPSIFAISIAILLAASLTGALVPAWRASHLDPMLALGTSKTNFCSF